MTATAPLPSVEKTVQGSRLARRVGWGVADQGVSSVGNFALGIILAHTLSAEEFGTFGLAFVAFGFAISAVRGPSTDPLLVGFSGPPDAAWRRAVSAASGCAFVCGITAGAVSLLVGLLLPGSLGVAFMALGLGLPGIMLQDSYRFAFFSCGKGHLAFVNDLLWALLQVGTLTVLVMLGQVGVGSALLVFGGTATVAALVGALQAQVTPSPRLVRAWLTDHKSLGGRFLVENVSIGASRQIRFIAVGVIAGLTAVGEIRAAEMLVGPFMILLAGASQVTIPEAKHVLTTAPHHLARFCFRLASAQAVVASVWTVAVLVVLPLGPGQLLLGDLWEPAEHLLPPLVIVLTLACFENTAAAGVRAMGASRRSLAAQLTHAVTSLLLGTGGAVVDGARGSCWGLAAGTFVAALVWWYHLRRALADHLPDGRPDPPSSSPQPAAAGGPEIPHTSGSGRVQLRNIQGLRGAAAFVVVFAHISGTDGIEEHLFGRTWISWTNFPANTGVDLFFVISGLIMMVTTWNVFNAPGTARRFVWRRLTRILPLYWLVNSAVVLTFVVRPANVTWDEGQSPGIWQSFLLLPREGRMPLLVSWSLVYEMFFYLVFTVAILLGRRRLGWVIGGWATATLALHLLVGESDNPYLSLISSPINLEFVFGTAIGYAVIRGRLLWPRRVLAFGILGVAAVWVDLGSGHWSTFPSDTYRLLGPGVAMALVVYGSVGLEIGRGRVCPRWLQRLGDASYSLYLIHVPAFTLLRMLLEKLLPASPITHAVVLVSLPVYAVAVALLCYRFVERPLQRVTRGSLPYPRLAISARARRGPPVPPATLFPGGQMSRTAGNGIATPDANPRRPAVLLDRDGTIIVDKGYVGTVERVELIDGVVEAIAALNAAGMPVVVVSNQAGVARGLFDLADVERVHAHLEKELARGGAHVDLWLFCPYHPAGVVPAFSRPSADRKPGPGMALAAATSLDLDLASSWVVGDSAADVGLARAVGARSILVGGGHTDELATLCLPDLEAAVREILADETAPAPREAFPIRRYETADVFAQHYVGEIGQALTTTDLAALDRAAKILAEAYDRDAAVFACGNGGSAAIANHLQCDHLKGVRTGTGLRNRVVSLSSNMELLSAIANDIGYDAVFEYQLESQARAGDVLLAISSSGSSPNIVRALAWAEAHGMQTIAMTGFDGGPARSLATVSIHVPSHNYGVVEDSHQACMHLLAQFVRQSRMAPEAIAATRF